MHLSRLSDARAERDPAGECIADDRVALTNVQFAGAVHALARDLVARGVQAGDVVAVMLPNRVELVTVLFAAWRVGAAVTPINPALTDDEAHYQIADSGARLLVADPDAVPGLDPRVERLDVAQISSDGMIDSSTPLRAEPDDLALLIYTSGTTGRPKGVMLDHVNLTAMTEMAIEGLQLGQDDHSLLILPLFHVNGIMASVISPLSAGGHTTIAGRFDPATFWSVIERVRPTFFSAVPTIYALLTSLPEDIQPDLSSLRYVICGAAPMPPELIARFEARYGVPIIEGYGLSEGTTASTLNPLDGVRKPGTVGLPIPGQQIRIVDAEGKPLPLGEAGEVVIAGPNVMRGYLNNAEATAESLRDGWLHTGDVGRFDENGYLVLVDRVKDMIIRGGENIYPKEIEAALYGHPAVLEAAVVGRPDPVFGEEPVAFVALRPGAAATSDELVEHCRATLARFKVPREVLLEPALPKNPVGKITKGPLRKRLRAAAAPVAPNSHRLPASSVRPA
jgi:long-chain acyl-CoA synthetase